MRSMLDDLICFFANISPTTIFSLMIRFCFLIFHDDHKTLRISPLLTRKQLGDKAAPTSDASSVVKPDLPPECKSGAWKGPVSLPCGKQRVPNVELGAEKCPTT